MCMRGTLMFLLGLLFFFPTFAFAGLLSVVSDVITDSRPSATSTLHTITFTVPNAIPVSGRVFLRPEGVTGSSFTIPVGFNYTDMTMAVSAGGGPFIPRSLAATPSALNDGVTVVTGASGTITFTLASGFNIPANATVRITLGNTRFIASPPTATSYRIRLETRNAVNTVIDRGTAMIAIVEPVTILTAAGDVVPPIRSNGLPDGLLPGSTQQVMVSLNTAAPATCKYATTSGVGFFAMATSSMFTKANFGLLHYVTVLTYENDLFTFYVRCMNESSIVNTDDYVIDFEIGVIPNASTTPAPPTPPAPSGPSGGGGGGGLFLLQGMVTMRGESIPSGTLVIMKDGVVVKEETISTLGAFDSVFSGLDRATYTWGAYVRDPLGKRTSVYNSTIYLIGGSNNLIAPIYLSPTIGTAETTIPAGSPFVVSGYAIPLKPVQVFMAKQGDAVNGAIIAATTTANGNGSWTLTLPTDRLTNGTYEVKAHTIISEKDQSNFSPILYVGLGEDPNPDFGNRSDLNKDGKVNLVDFSILLFNWKTSDAVADINQDGEVNLVDFSIMLANWTG
jgi:hypothetical protein